MEIPSKIKRRIPELEGFIELEIQNNPTFGKNLHKESFIHSMCRNISIHFVYKYYPEYSTYQYAGNYDKVEELVSIMRYLFRTKLTLYWEKLNDK